MAAAYEAALGTDSEAGRPKVTLLEQSDRFGGKIKTHKSDDFVIESGPDSIYTRKSGGLELVRELGLDSELVYSPANLKTGILRNGKVYSIPPGMSFGLPTNLRPFIFNSLIPFKGKVRGLLDFLLPADTTEGDKSIGDMLRRRIGDDLVNILAEPMLAGIYAGNINRLSVEAVAPYLRDMEQSNRSLVGAMLKQGKAARAASRRQQSTPAGKPRGVFVALTEGLEQLVDTLEDKLRPLVNLRKQTSVIQVRREDNGTFNLALRTSDGQTEQLAADAVIITVPAFAARRLIPAQGKTYDQLLDIPYVSSGTVSLVYPQRVEETRLPFTGFLVPRGEDEMLTACTVVSSKWPGSSRSGQIIVRGYIGRDGEEASLGKTDDVIVNHVKRQMQRYLGLSGNPVWQAVDRWPQSMPQYLVGHNDRVAAIRKQLALDVPLLYLAGAGYGGLGIPDCITQGRDAMKACLRDLANQPSDATISVER